MGKCCTFFGHRQSPDSLRPVLKQCLEDLILNHGVTTFYVGNQGSFDGMAHSVLRELAEQYANISYAVVLAYLPPQQKDELARNQDYADSMCPEGIETVPKRFAIDWRNRWMLKQADYVITYVTHSWGGAAKFAEKAVKSGKQVINLKPADNKTQSCGGHS